MVSEQSRTLTIPVIRIISPPAVVEPTVQFPVEADLHLEEAEPSAQAIIAQAQREADDMLAAARMEAEQIINEAKAQAEHQQQQAEQQVSQIFEHAKNTGYQAGYEEGKAASQSYYQQTIDQALELLHSIQAEKQQYYLQAQQELVQLACGIAGKIMSREVQMEDSWIVSTVKQALSEMIDPVKVEIYANPEEIALLASHRQELQSPLGGNSELTFVPDSSIEKGGCMLRTKQGAVDARIDTQVNEVKRALLDIAANL